jgi:AcrR family transcriptional regulator
MPRHSAPKPRKRPVQARSQATVDAIVDAAARVLIDGGYPAFSTNRVAARAGVSVGSLYQYFPNKESLLAELMSRHVADLARGFEAVMARGADAPLPEVVAALVEANVASHLVEPELHRILTAEVPPLGRLDVSAAFAARATERVRALLARRRAETTVEDLDLATYLIVRTVEATVHEAVVERPSELASGAVACEVTRLLVGYLTVTRPSTVSSRARSARRRRARAAPRPGSTIPSRARS